jgi:hypothetical protein
VSPAEITALAQFYYDPTTGLHNYLQFHNDIVSLDREEGGAKESIQLNINVKVLFEVHVYAALFSFLPPFPPPPSLPSSRNHQWLVLMRSFSESEMSSTRMASGQQSFSVIMTNSGVE